MFECPCRMSSLLQHFPRCLEVLHESTLPRNPQVGTDSKVRTSLEAFELRGSKKLNIPPLVVSEHYRAHIPASHAQSSTHESNEECASEGIPSDSDVPQDDESSNDSEEDVNEEERREILEPTFEESPTLNARGFSPMSEDVDMTGAPEPTNDIIFDTTERQNNTNASASEVPTHPQVSASLPSVEISQTGLEGEVVIEESGRGRRKRALRHIGDLNGCLCGKVVNPNVDSIGAIECRQPECETQWYHLDCVALERAPTKWVCEACDASGRARAKRSRK